MSNPYGETNAIVRAFAEARRYPTKLLRDGERVLPTYRHNGRKGFWALEPHGGRLLWALYFPETRKPLSSVNALRRLAADLEDLSSDSEVRCAMPEASALAVMRFGPQWGRVRVRSTRQFSATPAPATRNGPENARSVG